jgi:hypothetical protein
LQYLTWWIVIIWYGLSTMKNLRQAMEWMSENLMQVFHTIDYGRLRHITSRVMLLSSIYTIVELLTSIMDLVIDFSLWNRSTTTAAQIAVIIRVFSPVTILVLCSAFILPLSKIICNRRLTQLRVAETVRIFDSLRGKAAKVEDDTLASPAKLHRDASESNLFGTINAKQELEKKNSTLPVAPRKSESAILVS